MAKVFGKVTEQEKASIRARKVSKKSVWFLWLNDTTFERHYWQQDVGGYKGWTTDFSKARKFDTESDAVVATINAEKTTQAEVVVQEMIEA